MKYLFTPSFFFLCVLLTVSCRTSHDPIAYANTIAIAPDDSPETVVAKAAHVVPTANQWDALQNEFIAFVHFGPNTFTRMEWGTGMEDPKIFDLKTLDTDQWCQAMLAAGIKMVILTVKHHDGFVLWQSRYTTHGIMSTGFRDGKGDVLKDLSASCQKYGLKLGIYLSPADLYQIENPEGLYGNLSAYTKRTIPREVPGRPFENKTTFEFEVDDYNEYFLNQLFELLTEYGPIYELWFDGAHPKRKGGQTYHYEAWETVIRTLAPKAVIFGRSDIRWCGNESGDTRDTEWNVVDFPNRTVHELGAAAKLAEAEYLHYQQAETNTSIREGWFYRDDTHQKARSTDDVFDIYERAVGGNSTFLLNIPPNREGLFSPIDVNVLEETGARIRETYGTSLLKGAKGPRKVLDGNNTTFVEVDAPLVLRLKAPITFNRLMLQEPVQARGERVVEHAVDAWVDGAWQEIAHATNIGYKRILRFPEVTTSQIRIRITAARLTPALCHISAHYYPAQPPQVVCRRDVDGLVTLAAYEQEFNWKSPRHNIAQNLNGAFTIHYTTDGTDPDASSPSYTAPFKMGRGTLKAVSVLNQRTGPVLQVPLGLVQKDWKVWASSGAVKGREAGNAFDANPRTYWMSSQSATPFIALDLGQAETLTGFAYTPQKEHDQGMMAQGNVLVSNDGRRWEKVAAFSFGNLVNDPTQRFLYFDEAVTARYVRFEASQGEVLAVAELDLL